MTKRQAISSIKQKVAKGKVGEAIDQLLGEYIELLEVGMQDQMILISSQYYDIEKKEQLNIISNSNVTKNKVIFSLLSLLKEIESVELDDTLSSKHQFSSKIEKLCWEFNRTTDIKTKNQKILYYIYANESTALQTIKNTTEEKILLLLNCTGLELIDSLLIITTGAMNEKIYFSATILEKIFQRLKNDSKIETYLIIFILYIASNYSGALPGSVELNEYQLELLINIICDSDVDEISMFRIIHIISKSNNFYTYKEKEYDYINMLKTGIVSPISNNVKKAPKRVRNILFVLLNHEKHRVQVAAALALARFNIYNISTIEILNRALGDSRGEWGEQKEIINYLCNSPFKVKEEDIIKKINQKYELSLVLGLIGNQKWKSIHNVINSLHFSSESRLASLGALITNGFYESPNAQLGSNDIFKELVKICHKNGSIKSYDNALEELYTHIEKKYILENALVYHLIFNIEDKGKAWYIVKVFEDKFYEFKCILSTEGKKELEKYGIICDRGWGEPPPENIKAKYREKYGLWED